MIVTLVDLGTRPLLDGGGGLHPVLLRVARLLARDAVVYLCSWNQLALLESRVAMLGTVLTVDGDALVRVAPPERLDALWFYPTAGCAPPAVTPADHEALARMASLRKDVVDLDRNEIVAHLLLEAARRGVVANAPGPLGRWGRKDQLEYGLRWYQRVAGRRIERPETHPVSAAQARLVLASFAARGVNAIVKPANAARGEGLHLVGAGAELAGIDEAESIIVQELLQSPLLADDAKTDLRVYLLVDGRSRGNSRQLSPILVRRAACAYVPLDERAEITNTSYRRRARLPPGIAPLEGSPFEETVRTELRAQIHAISEDLLDALFLWKRTYDWSGNRDAARVMIWGLDFIAATTPGGVRVCLLEINVYPQLFRGDPACDALVDAMLLDDYLPAVRRARGLADITRAAVL